MKSSLLISLITFIFVLNSCEKDSAPPVPTIPAVPAVPSKLSDLQYKWILDSVIVYQYSNFTGARFVGYTGNNTQYVHFKSNGKSYTYSGFPTPSYDSADYNLTSDNAIILLYTYISGVKKVIPDTFQVRALTSTSLILAFRNPSNEYGKYAFHR